MLEFRHCTQSMAYIYNEISNKMHPRNAIIYKFEYIYEPINSEFKMCYVCRYAVENILLNAILTYLCSKYSLALRSSYANLCKANYYGFRESSGKIFHNVHSPCPWK